MLSIANREEKQQKVLGQIIQNANVETLESYIANFEHIKNELENYDQLVLDKEITFMNSLMQYAPKTEKNLTYFNKWENGLKHIASNKTPKEEYQKRQRDRIYNFDYFTKSVSQQLVPTKKKETGIKNIRLLPLLIVKAISMFTTLFLGNKMGNKTLLTNKINDCFAVLGQIKGFDITFDKQSKKEKFDRYLKNEKAEISADGKIIVNLILPTHRRPLEDTFMLAAFNIKHLLFLNPTAVLPKILGMQKLLAHAAGIIPVGSVRRQNKNKQSEETMETFLSELKKGQSYNVINYPQGFTTYKNEIIAIHPSFSEKMVQRLLSEGHDVRIFPVTYAEEADLFSDGKNKKMEIVFADPIQPETVKKLIAEEINSLHDNNERKLYLNEFIRLQWMKGGMNTSPEFKELNIKQMIERMNKYLMITTENKTLVIPQQRAAKNLSPVYNN